MPRPRRFRRVIEKPRVKSFGPCPPWATEEVVKMEIEELEAIRLKDYLGMKQEEAAKVMNVSQPTFHRILTSARSKIAEAIIEGKMIVVSGGKYIIEEKKYVCKKCKSEWPEEIKICPVCGCKGILHRGGGRFGRK
ncbi:protein of unknown function DUF134 [Methanothermus fervidus DSM 2088]|uniref:UPF0251 protein Mfer_0793 n=1 Tax=Methanothermus fervidus (strain ATCC 43054 / DSM 2088 / JCM 10308 / V24 S) TaxID=523846 RepID=E3GZ60_METFV|nr:DUF134 domain-containing protein [Methanothermus fervidus]ADP77592.1 protein of unknown function DUF134 [Methanothermus fervidus DSM 2088]